MLTRRFAASWVILAATSLGGCSQSVGVYHDFEGGAIARTRQPPPGANLPYPNLADVPAARAPAAPGTQAAIAARARGGVSAPSAGALAGLSLPAAPPPVPDVPGLDIVNPAAQAAAPKPAAKPAAPRPAPAPKPPGPPVSIAFPAGSALLPYKQAQVIQGVAGQRGGAKIRVFGFGEGSLALGLARARRMADQLTAAGVPGNEIDINALAAGSGGFVQLVY